MDERGEMMRGQIAAALMQQQAPPQQAGNAPDPATLPPQGIVAPSGVLQVPNMPFSLMPAGGGSPYLGYDDKPFQGAPSPLGAPPPTAPSPAAAPPPMAAPASSPSPVAAPAPPPSFDGGGGRGGGGMMPSSPTPMPAAPPPQPFFGGNDPAPTPSPSAPYQKPSGELVVPDMPFTMMMPSALYGPFGKYGTDYDRRG
jgi:hypothetical protein